FILPSLLASNLPKRLATSLLPATSSLLRKPSRFLSRPSKAVLPDGDFCAQAEVASSATAVASTSLYMSPPSGEPMNLPEVDKHAHRDRQQHQRQHDAQALDRQPVRELRSQRRHRHTGGDDDRERRQIDEPQA